MAALVLVYPTAFEVEFPLERTVARIGRGAECEIRLNRGSVSRLHARIRWAEGGWVVEDLASENGIAVNDVVVARAVLRDGDVLRVGDAVLRLVE